jgi:hypothetical protein
LTRKNKSRRVFDEDGSRHAQLIWTLCVAIAVAVSALYRVANPSSGQVFAARGPVMTGPASGQPQGSDPVLKALDPSAREADELPADAERVPASDNQTASSE